MATSKSGVAILEHTCLQHSIALARAASAPNGGTFGIARPDGHPTPRPCAVSSCVWEMRATHENMHGEVYSFFHTVPSWKMMPVRTAVPLRPSSVPLRPPSSTDLPSYTPRARTSPLGRA